jgi:hypothetical protein
LEEIHFSPNEGTLQLFSCDGVSHRRGTREVTESPRTPFAPPLAAMQVRNHDWTARTPNCCRDRRLGRPYGVKQRNSRYGIKRHVFGAKSALLVLRSCPGWTWVGYGIGLAFWIVQNSCQSLALLRVSSAPHHIC